MLRLTVELRLEDVNDSLFGYEYASRQLVEDLFLSYTTWDGVDGYYGAPDVVDGVANYFEDFGATGGIRVIGSPTSPYQTVDDYSVWRNYRGHLSYAFYGTAHECGGTNQTCYSEMTLYYDYYEVSEAALLWHDRGWDANADDVLLTTTDYSSAVYGSYLVRANVVPTPSTIWLFGSGLIGLIGVARRKKA